MDLKKEVKEEFIRFQRNEKTGKYRIRTTGLY